jgi:bifunctional non-homologous end joining protein LigD
VVGAPRIQHAADPEPIGNGNPHPRRLRLSGSSSSKSRAPTSAKPQAAATNSRVNFTHVEKIMFPDAGLTKGDIFSYYARISSHLLPHLKDRPITVERLPDGINGPRFWQKNTPPYYPSWIKRVELPTESGKRVQYALVNDMDTLLYFVNQGALTFHVYMSRVRKLDRPDYVLFDLDPSASTFANVVTIAKEIHETLKKAKIDCYAKTSGKSGLHVLVPWLGHTPYGEAREWALHIADEVCAALPMIATTERSIAARGKRVYVDVMQNALGKHAVPPYVIRTIPEATVSTPLEWRELTARLNPKKFTVTTALNRFVRRKDPLAELVE